MKKIVRLTERDLKRIVNKTIKEERINELGGMEDSHPKFGDLNLGKHSKEELDDILYGSERKEKNRVNFLPFKRRGTVDLRLGDMYQVYDSGMDDWNDDHEYLGFDMNNQEYMFRYYDGSGFWFIGVPKNEVNNDVKPSRR